MPGPHLGGKWCPVQCVYRDKHIQICSPYTLKLVRYKPAPVKVTQTVLFFVQHCLSASLRKSHGDCPHRYTPQPALKAAEDNSNLSPNWALFALPGSRSGRGQGGCQSIGVWAVRASCCFVLPIAETVCTLLVQITSTFLVPPRNHLLRS